MRMSGVQPTSYSFFDEIDFTFTTSYTCQLVRETSVWRLIRLASNLFH